MDNLNSNKYVSLKTAAGLYGYTRDHLGLMIRQGKLKGIKLGSYYVTTNEWVVDYIKNFANPNHPTSRNKLSNKFLTEILSSRRKTPFIVASVENFAKKPTKTIAPKRVQNNAGKSHIASADFEEDILKELVRYKSLASGEVLKANFSQAENTVSTLPMSSDAPYVILPIRKMENAEREEIFNKI